HAPHYTQFLMYGRCLQYAFLNESNLRLHLDPLLEPPTKIRFNIVGVHAREFGVFEHASQVFQRALVNFVCLLRAEGRSGEILQVKIRPLPKCEILPAAQRRQCVVVLGLQSLSEAFLRFAPVFGKGRFPLAVTIFISVTHAPDFRSRSLVQAAIMLYWSCHSTTSCLKVARKGSNSDLKNRIFRPITRRWGICFRSTQRYTVWGLTPKKTAACRTVRGISSGTG